MTNALIFTERITIIRPRMVRGEYGGLEEDWDNPEEIEFPHAVSVQPVESIEDTDGRSHFISDRWRVFTEPPHLIEELRPTDRVRVDTWGQVLWGVARPLHWRTAVLPHSEFDLEEIRGTDRAGGRRI